MRSFYYFQKCGLPEGFRLYDMTGVTAGAGRLLMTRGAEGVASSGGGVFDLERLGLSAGRYTLEVTAVDAWGTESARASESDDLNGVIEVVIGAYGSPATELVGVSQVRGYAAEAGSVAVEWVSAPRFGGAVQVAASAFELTVTAAGGTIPGEDAVVVATVLSEGGARFKRTLTLAEHGVADGSMLMFWVRSSDGVAVGSGGRRTAWVGGASVRVDATGPGLARVVLPRLRVC